MFRQLPGHRRTTALGITSRKAACTKKNVVLVADNDHHGSGLLAAVHELGHTLGSPHDGSETSTSCPAGGGYIMNPYLYKQKHVYSKCSKAAMKTFLASSGASCLFRRRCPEPASTADQERDEKLRNAQCLSKVRENEEFLNATVIHSCTLSCYVILLETKEVASFERSAPDGMRCDENGECKECQGGMCKFIV
ncbi:disintegrin metalloproteinase/disintegrin echistatin-like [Dermacentor andersoni]|uniref:disintegrin metalloproteinase/disintegrin echistatin-like n=1 Tax=Dermacentor andersoni TaxID=34620 RepID=UPI002415D8E1|nr:disintegrin metalloproteinase/disintegrin echistatin-like [Dermacentor andersoni]